MPIARQRIRLPERAWRSAIASLLRGRLWEGPDIARFEADFAKFIGAGDAVAVPSGRAGFRCVFEALSLAKGVEVICSAFGYPVVPFLVKSLGYKLRFVDCEMRTLGMDPDRLAATISDSTGAVIGTHLYGVPCQIDRIAEIASKHSAALIEDCAHCYGAAVSGKKVGSFGDAACFSFETSKVINTMGGGMVTVRDPELGKRIREIAARAPRNGLGWLLKRLGRTTFEAAVTHPLLFNLGVYQALRAASLGKGSEERFASGYHGDEISMAGKMGRYTNYQARLGLQAMRTAGEVVARREALAMRLIDQLRGKLQFQEPAKPDVFANFMLVTALVPDLASVSARLLRAGIDTKHLYMRDCSGIFDTGETFPNAARAEREVLHIPAHPHLPESEIDRIATAVAKVIDTPAAPQPA
jgi:dTDP-4-amino-4,6-dideoxygalactose transaminase